MKKAILLIVAVSLVFSIISVIYADDALTVQMIGREIYAGKETADGTNRGALFIGKFFNSNFTAELGRFTVILDHDNLDVEVCGGRTELQRFKLIMNFNTGARLVLVKPRGVTVDAAWLWDDPECLEGNCPIIDAEDYLYYLVLLDLFDLDSPAALNLVDCYSGSDNVALIAQVPIFRVQRQWFGSYGTRFTRGSVSGYLVHTPIISPAIFGTLQLLF
jgi:hypothetical protein